MSFTPGELADFEVEEVVGATFGAPPLDAHAAVSVTVLNVVMMNIERSINLVSQDANEFKLF